MGNSRVDYEAAADQLAEIGLLADAPRDWLLAEARAVVEVAITQPADIVDLHLIAKRLGIRKDTVNKWRYRNLLPPPDYPDLVSPIWDWDTISRWAHRTGRL